MKLGRRDARTASRTAANNDIPQPTFSLSRLISTFQKQGLSTTDMVALSGILHTSLVYQCDFARCFCVETHRMPTCECHTLEKEKRINHFIRLGVGLTLLLLIDWVTQTHFHIIQKLTFCDSINVMLKCPYGAYFLHQPYYSKSCPHNTNL